MGPLDYRSTSGRVQEPSFHFRQRRCLLKGCEQPFRPSHPQARYCSDGCRQEARRWRCWRSHRTYRASEAGKQCRRQQARRYRERQRQCRHSATCQDEPLQAIEEAAEPETVVVHDVMQLELVERSEGQRPASIPENFVGQSCARPGCYELFPIRQGVPQQRYCSCRCRQALRRVLDREARWRWRHRQRRRWRRPRPPPC